MLQVGVICLAKENKKESNNGLFVLLFLIVLLFAFVLFNQFSSRSAPVQSWKLLVDEKDGISVEVQPLKLSHIDNSEFSVAFNTHQGSLDFDPAKISVMGDNLGNNYVPLKWDGSPAGGHHRRGTLVFSKINDDAMEISLVIKIGTSERKFEWGLH